MLPPLSLGVFLSFTCSLFWYWIMIPNAWKIESDSASPIVTSFVLVYISNWGKALSLSIFLNLLRKRLPEKIYHQGKRIVSSSNVLNEHSIYTWWLIFFICLFDSHGYNPWLWMQLILVNCIHIHSKKESDNSFSQFNTVHIVSFKSPSPLLSGTQHVSWTKYVR